MYNVEVTFLDLRCKEVVNVLDGRKLGHIVDVVFDLNCARILGFIVPSEKTGWNFFKGGDQLFVPFGCVVKIGEDTLLVELPPQGVPTNPYILTGKNVK